MMVIVVMVLCVLVLFVCLLLLESGNVGVSEKVGKVGMKVWYSMVASLVGWLMDR